MSDVEVLAAYDEAPIKRLPLTDAAGAAQALERGFALHRDRNGWLSAAQRIAILECAAALMESRAEALAQDAAREGGKPLQDSKVEVARAIEGVKLAVKEMWNDAGKEVPMALTKASEGRFAYTYREPGGLVLAISAFNHPLNLIVHQVIPAIAAGCPVIVKPALTTPISCQNMVDILYEAGLPRDWCQMVVCDNAVAELLVTSPRVSFMTFIGSARVGWSLRSKLAPGAACALEHGGVAPAIVDETADLNSAIPLLVKGGFYHAGQVCVSVQRVYVHESVASGFTERFVETVKHLRVGDPLDEATEVGPLITSREVDRVDEWVQEAVAGGGRLLCGGSKLSSTCYAPTVVLNPPDDCRLSTEEIFGPVVAVYTYTDTDEAVARANAPETFFQASVFTQQLDRSIELSRRLNGMAVMVNDHTAFRVDWMPFGGHRQSGLAQGGISYSMREMSIERMVVLRSAAL